MTGDPTVIAKCLVGISIARAKITDYLLNPGHRDGGPKARFFLSFGFTADDPDVMQRALVTHLLSTSVHTLSERPQGHGPILTAIGPLGTPDGRNPVIKSVWMWRMLASVPPTGRETSLQGTARLVTAYPYQISDRA